MIFCAYAILLQSISIAFFEYVSVIMSSMKSAAAKRPIARKHTKLKVFWVIVLMLALTGLVWWQVARIVHHRAVEHQREQFTQAEKDLDALSQSIIAKFGKPEQNIKTENCNYTSAFNEFAAHGDLVCSVNHEITYSVANVDDGIKYSKQISTSINRAQVTKEYWADDDMLSSQTPISLGSTYLNFNLKLACNIEYNLYAPRDVPIYKYPYTKSSLALLVSSTCGSRPAEAQYFPLIKD